MVKFWWSFVCLCILTSNISADPKFKDWFKIKNPFKKTNIPSRAASIELSNIGGSLNHGNLNPLPPLRRVQSTGNIERVMQRTSSSLSRASGDQMGSASRNSLRRSQSLNRVNEPSKALVPYNRDPIISLPGKKELKIKQMFDKKFFNKAILALAAVDGAKHTVNGVKSLYNAFNNVSNVSEEVMIDSTTPENSLIPDELLTGNAEALFDSSTPVITESILIPDEYYDESTPSVSTESTPFTTLTSTESITTPATISPTTIITTTKIVPRITTTRKRATMKPNSKLNDWIHRNINKKNEITGKPLIPTREPYKGSMASSIAVYTLEKQSSTTTQKSNEITETTEATTPSTTTTTLATTAATTTTTTSVKPPTTIITTEMSTRPATRIRTTKKKKSGLYS